MTESSIHHGNYYRDLAKAVGLSQLAIADQIAASQSTVHRYFTDSEYLTPEIRFRLEKAILPEARSRGIEFKSLLPQELYEQLHAISEEKGQSQFSEPDSFRNYANTEGDGEKIVIELKGGTIEALLNQRPNNENERLERIEKAIEELTKVWMDNSKEVVRELVQHRQELIEMKDKLKS